MQEKSEQPQSEQYPDTPSHVVKETAPAPEPVAEPAADWQGYDPEILSTVLDA
jgi:hypothetical protein